MEPRGTPKQGWAARAPIRPTAPLPDRVMRTVFHRLTNSKSETLRIRKERFAKWARRAEELDVQEKRKVRQADFRVKA